MCLLFNQFVFSFCFFFFKGIHRETIAFRSHPEFTPTDRTTENPVSIGDSYKFEWRRETEGPNRLGVFQRLATLFGNHSDDSRKSSTASFTGLFNPTILRFFYFFNFILKAFFLNVNNIKF